MGDRGDRGLDPEALELDLPREARGGCSAKRNVGWGAAELEKGTIQCQVYNEPLAGIKVGGL